MGGYYSIDFGLVEGSNNKEDENTDQDSTSSASCSNCFSHGTKFFDTNACETICRFCGIISDDAGNNSTSISEVYRNLYKMDNLSMTTDNFGGNSLSGSGSSIITSFETSMDFSKSGILSGHISKTDSNNKRVGMSYSKLIYTERNSFKSTSANREVNITEGITTILKITEKLKIPHHIGERAANIFRMFYPKEKEKRIKYVNITNLLNNSKKLGNDKNVSAKFVSIACVYFALRENQDITSLIEFVNIILKSDCIDSKMYTKDIIKKIINKIYNIMTKEFDLEISYPDTRNTINHICNSYSIDETIKRDSIYLYEVINSNISIFQGTAPRTIAIVLIYISFIRNRRIPAFIKKTDLSIITLKKLYNKYLDNLYYIREINEGRYGELKEGLDNGYKNKVINGQPSTSIKVNN